MVETHPEALLKFCKAFGLTLTVIGLEADPLSQWLYRALTDAGFMITLRETRQINAVLSAMTVKTDRRDAGGIAQLLRAGWFRGSPKHPKPSACPAGCTQAAPAQANRHRTQHPWHSRSEASPQTYEVYRHNMSRG